MTAAAVDEDAPRELVPECAALQVGPGGLGEAVVGAVNFSGDLEATGHPPGATGVSQWVEPSEQLRGCQQSVRSAAQRARNIGGLPQCQR